jgi:host factor-I protein
MSQFDPGLPSVRQVQSYIQDKQEVEIKLISDDLLVGRIIWQDPNCLCLVDHYEKSTLIWQQSLVYLRPKA